MSRRRRAAAVGLVAAAWGCTAGAARAGTVRCGSADASEGGQGGRGGHFRRGPGGGWGGGGGAGAGAGGGRYRSMRFGWRGGGGPRGAGEPFPSQDATVAAGGGGVRGRGRRVGWRRGMGTGPSGDGGVAVGRPGLGRGADDAAAAAG